MEWLTDPQIWIAFATLTSLEGVDQHVPKGYIYFAMGFSLFVEMLNLAVRRRRKGKGEPIKLRQIHTVQGAGNPRP